MTNEHDALVGQVVEERYRIEAVLGAGGMGAVYRARHVRVGREVAIKVLHDHLVQDPTMVERFEREAAIAARLAHRNLINVIDVGETPAHQKLMVLELARGKNLADIIAQGPLAPARVVALAAQLLSGLEHAHDAGLVHRDLKPDNVIVEVDEHGNETPKIVDFGIAMLRDERDARLTANGQVLGTPQYMAPEHAQGKDVDPRCDLFALGVMMYEMLAGRLPFDAQGIDAAIANITKEPPALAERTPGVEVDPLVEAFVRRLMARRRGDRFQSARTALDLLERIQAPRGERSEREGKEPGEISEREAAYEILVRPAGRPAPFALVARRVPRASVSAAANTLPMAAAVPPTVIGAPVVYAAPAPCKPERPRFESRAQRPRWRPWKSFGLLAGALAGAITAAIVAGPLAARVEAAPLSAELAMSAPSVRLTARTVAAVEPPPAPLPVEVVAKPPMAARVAVVPRPVLQASVERVVVTPVVTPIVEGPSAADLATRYVALGHELARASSKRDVDPIVARYRRIHIQRALATPAARAAVLRELASLERALD